MKLTVAVLTCASLLLTSCATIFNRSNQPVKVASEPSGLSFTVTDSKGMKVASGTTPGEANLKTSPGYFKAGSYTFEFRKGNKAMGTCSLNASVSGWYAGNLLFGGPIGLLIIDPLSGSMYTLPDDVNFKGQTMTSVTHPAAGSITIASVETLSPAQRARLVRL